MNTIKPLALILCAISLTACATPSQVYWDHKVKELCEKDGGVTVYEKVELTQEERKNIKIRNIKYATENDAYYSEFHSQAIKEGNPKLLKNEYFLYRNADKKLLGKQVDYTRIGGDIPTGVSHDSSYSCDQVGVSTEIQNAIFVIKGE